MKSIKLKEYQDGINKATTQQLLTQIIDFSGTAGGITTSEQRKRIKLIDVIEPQYESGELNLEDADFKYLTQLIDEMKWAGSNKIIREFIKDFS